MVYLVRQGQTDWNRLKKFNGTTETQLNETGVTQAQQQAKALEAVSFDVCFCSPQQRTRQTCEIIYKGNIVFDQRLSEIDCGEFEGTEETPESMKLFWQAVMTGDKGTESFKSFMDRNCDVCDFIAQEYSGQNILIVTHAANARVINYYFSGKPKDYDFSKAVAQDGEIITFDLLDESK
ncbi:histidine phosphatase family protein [Oscillospiraceae bacterium MB08-C2-2]|nr:histidine phosphatase family protein [Oscillospiraceae bacterium MB08-C2-2]